MGHEWHRNDIERCDGDVLKISRRDRDWVIASLYIPKKIKAHFVHRCLTMRVLWPGPKRTKASGLDSALTPNNHRMRPSIHNFQYRIAVNISDCSCSLQNFQSHVPGNDMGSD